MIIGHSAPLWILGPRGDTFGDRYPGIEHVAERAQIIADLPMEICSHTSFHILHEIKTKIRGYEHLNSPFAMSIDDLVQVMGDKGKRILAVIVPAFGFDDIHEGGAILSSDIRVRMRARDVLKEGLELCEELREKGIGDNVFVWWPSTDSLRYPFSDQELEDGRRRLIDFWRELLAETKSDVWIEFKPGDPGDRDHFATAKEALDFVNGVNQGQPRPRAWVNFEFAHASMIGQSVADTMKMLLDHNVVETIVHVNSSGLGMDMDKRVGAINNEDTAAALRLLRDSKLRVVLEHDIKCTDGDPIAYYQASVAATDEMLAS